MANFVEGLMPHGWTPKKGEFKPLARYFPEMDFLIYLNEDCSYRADRVDAFLTVLWHPERDALVGIKLKGFRFLFKQIKAILDWKETEFLPTIMDAAETERRQRLYEYEQAKRFASHLELKLVV